MAPCDRAVVQPRAAHVLSRSWSATLAHARIFCGVYFIEHGGSLGGSRRRVRGERRRISPPIAMAEWASAAALVLLTVLVATHPFAPSLQHGKH